MAIVLSIAWTVIAYPSLYFYEIKSSNQSANVLLNYCKSMQSLYPNETDYTKLECAQTINPSLFSTNCVQAGLSDTKPADYGCPIIPDSTTWTLYVGESCHSPETDTRDHNRCKSGAVMRRVDLNVGEDGLYNLCQSDDFTNLDPLKNIDKRGIVSVL